MALKTDSLEWGRLAIVISVLTAFVLGGIAWGRAEKGIADNERRISSLETQLDKIQERLAAIERNTAVTAAWVELQKDKVK